MRWRWFLIAVLAATSAAAVACGTDGETTASAGAAAEEPRSVRYPYAVTPQAACGGLPFPRTALRRARGFERRDTPLARTLRRFLRRNARGIGQDRTGWFLLVRRGRVAEVASKAYEGEYGHMTFRRRGGRWKWTGSGGCFPAAWHDGLEASGWERRRPQAPLDPAATRIPVFVHEDACASGREARGRVEPPLVHYGRGTLTVTYFIRPPTGGQTCQGNPPTRATLVLDEPVGDRVLRDGGSVPPHRQR